MKKAAILLSIILLGNFAAALRVEKLDTQVSIDGQGFASVTENYILGFISDFEFNDFKKSAQRNTSSLSAWKSDYNFFTPHFAGSTGNTIISSFITFDEGSKTLTLKYALQKKFANLQSSEQRSDTYAVPDSQLAEFNVGGTIVIPENTTIIIMPPANSEVDATKLPDKVRVINGNQIVLSGIQSNSLNVQYNVLKPIAPTSDDLFSGISNTYILAPLVALIIIGIYVKRDEIEEKVEDYLVEHSEIKPRESEEMEIDFGK